MTTVLGLGRSLADVRITPEFEGSTCHHRTRRSLRACRRAIRI